ncbi:integrase arm-type DNA-binding domain-containing protein [Mesorhizobium sp. BR1-1-16]|uniref:tyrosine-type recombinase/integrase n=1 Tax=Mesorhizobium sp. BR1-1-16 TaxID=2876653 RepID=UPI001CC90857|nr:integrase arm-type DNA-binding domain-containing protein [Mesorhizobium sp. BR1-1-16]MBZ9935818.1 integrase arm-type DNA-binding domain-containing protein [Mesorhizobium sp. BR1-1-16]
MPLTDTAIRNAKPTDKPFKLADGGGLFLLINPTGSRLWRLKYRIEGREKLLAIGPYPDVTLAKARERREEARRLIASGADPSAIKKQSRQDARAATENTFRAVAEDHLAKLEREGLAEITLGKRRWLLGFAYPKLGARDVATITASEVLEVLRSIETTGRHETARRLRSSIGAVFRYAIATARAENDPTFALRDALTTPQVRHRSAITTPNELGQLLRAIDGYSGQPATTAALRLMPLLFPRPGELRAAHWSEFDLDNAIWSIPAERMKMRRPHRVPLQRQAVAILRELQALTGEDDFVFPCIGAAKRPISDNTLNGALRRLGFGPDVATAHGFRATASTLLNESGLWNPDAIERQLAHADGDAVRRAYARSEHWDERVKMMTWWADQLDILRRLGVRAAA